MASSEKTIGPYNTPCQAASETIVAMTRSMMTGCLTTHLVYWGREGREMDWSCGYEFKIKRA